MIYPHHRLRLLHEQQVPELFRGEVDRALHYIRNEVIHWTRMYKLGHFFFIHRQRRRNVGSPSHILHITYSVPRHVASLSGLAPQRRRKGGRTEQNRVTRQNLNKSNHYPSLSSRLSTPLCSELSSFHLSTYEGRESFSFILAHILSYST